MISRSSRPTCSTAKPRRVGDRILGYALYIDPPLGRVGMTEAQARASGRKLLSATRPMSRVARAISAARSRRYDRCPGARGRPQAAERLAADEPGCTSDEKGETQGFMKITVDAETRKILGAAILGPGGDEAIHGILDVMNAGVPYTALQRAMPIHPTVSELIPTLLGDLQPVN